MINNKRKENKMREEDVKEITPEEILAEYQGLPLNEPQDEGENLIKVEEA